MPCLLGGSVQLVGCECVRREFILEKSQSSLMFCLREPRNEQKLRKREMQSAEGCGDCNESPSC